MEFRGRLKAPGDPGEGIAVELRLADVYLELGSAEEELGRWRLDEVVIERVAGDLFDLTLEGESLVFVAADALSFAYEGLAYADETRAKLKKRRRRKKGRQPESLLSRLQEGDQSAPVSTEGGVAPVEPTASDGVAPPPISTPATPAPAVPVAPTPAASPPAHEGVPVVVEAPAVSYVDTLSTVIAEIPDELPVIGSEPGPTSVAPAEESAPTAAPVSSRPPSPETAPPVRPDREDVESPAPISSEATTADDGEDENEVTGNGSVPSGSMRRLLDRLGRKPDDHEHVYGDARRTGVITRRVCEICGHVTFDSDRAYRGW